MKNLKFYLILFFLAIGLFGAKTYKQDKIFILNQVQNTEIRFCIVYKNKFFKIFNNGSIKTKNNNNTIALVKHGCFVLTKKICRNLGKLSFIIDDLKRFDYNLDFNIRKNSKGCVGNNPIINKINISHKQFIKLENLALSVPYVENVSLDNQNLLNQIKPKVKKCDSNQFPEIEDKISCKIFNTYRYVVNNYKYIEDRYQTFSKKDLIYSPEKTVKRGGGDCEDLSGLLLSYLANQNIETYMVLTDNHAYGMACGLSEKTMAKLVENSFKTSDTKSDNFILKPREIKYFSSFHNFKFQAKINLDINSSELVNIYSVPSENEAKKLANRKTIKYWQNCSQINSKIFNKQCQIPINTGIIVQNLSTKVNAKINFKITYYYNKLQLGNSPSIRYYLINNNRCVVLEPTVGINGYPGFSVDQASRKLAVNPINWKWLILK